MADLTIQSGDTWPEVKGYAEDDDGPLNLPAAARVEILLKRTTASGDTIPLIRGDVEVIEPPEVQDDGTWNWRYIWAAGDTDIAGEYRGQLLITWETGSTPPRVESVPNTGGFSLVIEEANV